MARPRIEINQNEFEKLCGIQCTLTEIAEYFKCTEDTIENWCKRTYKQGFSEVFSKKRSSGKISLRRKQFEVALSGNVPMLIFLGKNWLGQSDKVTTEIESDISKEIPKLYEALGAVRDTLNNDV